MIFRIIITLTSLCVIAVQSAVIDKPGFDRFEDISVNAIHYKHELSKAYHFKNGREFVAQQIHKKRNLNTNIAKNAILFLGDGMSMPNLAASRIYMGGEDKQLSFERFPFVSMSKTYCVNKQVADSACTSTAYLSGVKSNYGTIGVNGKVPRSHCSASNDESTHTESIAQWALNAGKSVGLVTTTRVTHASPAGVYAHTSERDWESNADVEASQCKNAGIDDIAQQLIHGPVGKRLNVIFGGGRANFLTNTEPEGQRTDGKNLIHEWLNSAESGKNRTYVSDKAGLLSIHPKENESYLGLFTPSHVDFNYEVNGISDTIPTLTEMTMKAIEILKMNPNGFFLFVEAGKIDLALHEQQAHIAIDETAEFSRSVELATSMLSTNDTLFVTTADHAHTLSLSGYAARGSNVFGVGGRSEIDSKPYLKLSFANGKGYKNHVSNTSFDRVDPAKMSVNDFKFLSPATVPLQKETHGGDDAVIYAAGPYSHLFTGTVEQNIIPHYMAYALCIGHGHTACKTRNTSS